QPDGAALPPPEHDTLLIFNPCCACCDASSSMDTFSSFTPDYVALPAWSGDPVPPIDSSPAWLDDAQPVYETLQAQSGYVEQNAPDRLSGQPVRYFDGVV